MDNKKLEKIYSPKKVAVSPTTKIYENPKITLPIGRI